MEFTPDFLFLEQISMAFALDFLCLENISMAFACIYWVKGWGWSDSPHFFTGLGLEVGGATKISPEFTGSERWLGLGRGLEIMCKPTRLMEVEIDGDLDAFSIHR